MEFLPTPDWKALEDAVFVDAERSGALDGCVDELLTTLEGDEELSKRLAEELLQHPSIKESLGNLVVGEQDGGDSGTVNEEDVDGVVAEVDGKFEEDLLQMVSERIWKYLAPEGDYSVAKMVKDCVRESVCAFYEGRPTDPSLKHIPSFLVEEINEPEPDGGDFSTSPTALGEEGKSSQSGQSRKRQRDSMEPFTVHSEFEGHRPHKRRWGPSMDNSEIPQPSDQHHPPTNPDAQWDGERLRSIPGPAPPSEPYPGDQGQNPYFHQDNDPYQSGYGGRGNFGQDRGGRGYYGDRGGQGWGRHNGGGGKYHGNMSWSRHGNSNNDGYSRQRDRRWDRSQHKDNRSFNQSQGWGNSRRGSNEGGRGGQWNGRREGGDGFRRY
ncbi:hypothetical protein BSKO_06133 [Bryopsis sp. KO-2023]|nr:hypothetical protein BSKO_06133 [Bryopsis sp. KO-2023]